MGVPDFATGFAADLLPPVAEAGESEVGVEAQPAKSAKPVARPINAIQRGTITDLQGVRSILIVSFIVLFDVSQVTLTEYLECCDTELARTVCAVHEDFSH